MIARSRHREAITFFQQLVDTSAAKSSAGESAERRGLAAHALTCQSFFFAGLGDFDKQVSCLERNRAAVEQYGTPREIAIHCHLYALSRADPEEARGLFERSLAILRGLSDM